MSHRYTLPLRGVVRLALVGLVACLGAAGQASGQALSPFWVSATSGDWSVPGNFNNTPVSSDETRLIFLGAGFGGVAANNDLASPFLLNQLYLVSDAFFFPNSIVGGALQFEGASGAIFQYGDGDFVIDTPLVLNTNLLLTGGGMGTVTISGAISELGSLRTVTKTGTSRFVLTGDNSFTGNVSLTGGVLGVGHSNALGLGNGVVVAPATGMQAAIELFGDVTITQTLSMNGLGILGTGALRNISGNNAWTGTVTLTGTTRIQSDAGVLTIGSDGVATAMAQSTRILTIGGEGDGIILGPITATTGTLTKVGTGTWTLSGASSYAAGSTGAKTVREGTLVVETRAGLGGGTVTVAPLDVGASAVLSIGGAAGSMVNAGDTANSNTSYTFGPRSTLRFDNTVAYDILDPGASVNGRWFDTAGIALNGARLEMLGNAAEAVSEIVGGVTYDGNSEVRVLSAGQTTTLNAASLVRTGRGTLTLLGTAGQLGTSEKFVVSGGMVPVNGMVGPSIVNGTDAMFVTHDSVDGFMNATATSADLSTSTSTDIVVSSGAALGGAAEAWALKASGAITGGTVTLGSGGLITQATGGPVTHTSDFVFGSSGAAEALIFASGDTSVISGTVTTAGGLTKFGPGTLVLSGDNSSSLSGGVVVHSGVLMLGHAGALGSAANTLTVSGGLLNLGGFSVTLGQVALFGDGFITDGTISASANYILEYGTVNASLTGAGGLTKQGLTRVVLMGANTYSGATTVTGGSLRLRNSDAVAGTTGTITISSGAAIELQEDVLFGPITIAGKNLNLAGTGVGGTGALVNISGDNAWTGTITLSGAATIASDSGTLTLGQSGSAAVQQVTLNLTLSGDGDGVIAGSITRTNNSTTTITKTGTGTWTLLGHITAGSGTITVSQGRLRLGANDRIPNNNPLTINGGQAVFDVQEFTDVVGVVSLLNGGEITGTTGTLTGSSYSLQSGIVSAILGGTGLLTKSTTGTLTMSATSTRTGASTLLDGDTIVLNRQSLGSGDINLTASGSAQAPRLTVGGAAGSLVNGAGTGNNAVNFLTQNTVFTLDNTIAYDFGAGGATPHGRWHDTTGLTIQGGTFALTGNAATAVNEVIGGLSFDRGSNLMVMRDAVGVATVLEASDLSRLNRGTLAVSGRGALGTDERVRFGAAPAVVNDMLVLPVFDAVNSMFLTYDASSDGGGVIGLKTATATSTVLDTAVATDIVVSGAVADLLTDRTVHALKATGKIEGAEVQVDVGSGMLISDLAADAAHTSTFAFGGGLGEAVIYASGAGVSRFSGQIVAGDGLTAAGPGVVELAGNNVGTLVGPIWVNSGVLRGIDAGSLGAATNTITLAGGTLDLRSNGAGSDGVVTYGHDIVLGNNGPGRINVGNNGFNTGNTIELGNLVVDGALSTLRVTSSDGYRLQFNTTADIALVDPLELEIDTGATVVFDGTGKFTGAGGGITKSLGGQLILAGTGANDFTGGVTVAGGTLRVQNATAFGASGGTNRVEAGASLLLDFGDLPGGGATITGETITVAGGSLRSVSGDNAWTGVVTVNTSTATIAVDAGSLTLGTGAGTAITMNTNMTLTGTGVGIVNGNIAAQATRTLTKTGIGTWILAGTSARTTGVTTISSGTLVIQRSNSLGTNSTTVVATGAVTVANGATLALDGSAFGDVRVGVAGTVASSRPLTLSGSGIQAGGSLRSIAGDNAWLGNITIAATNSSIMVDSGSLTLGQTGSTLTITNTAILTVGGAGEGVIAANIAATTGALTKNGTGRWTILGTANHTGATTVSAGTLRLEGTGRLAGTVGNVTVATGATLELKDLDNAGTRNITSLIGAGVGGGGALRNVSGNNTWTGVITLGGAATIASDSGTLTLAGDGVGGNALVYSTRALTLAGDGNGVINGPISATSGTLTKNGAGTWTLNFATPSTGATTVNDGILRYGVADALGSSVVNIFGGTLDLAGFTGESFATLRVEGGTITGTAGGSQVTINTAANFFDGMVDVVFDGGGTLRKQTGGTMVITKSNAAFLGPSFLQAGTLEVQGRAGLGSGALTLAPDLVDGATLVLSGDEGSLVNLSDTGKANSSVTFGPNLTIRFDNTTAYTGGAAQGRWADFEGIFLDNGALEMIGNAGVAQSESVGAVSYSGNSRIKVQRGGDGVATTLAMLALARNPGGTLILEGTAGELGGDEILTAGNGASLRLASDVMVGPFVVNGADTAFVTYDDVLGFVNATVTPTTLALSTALDIVTVDSLGEVLLADAVTQALKAQGAIDGSGGLFTVDIDSGGFIADVVADVTHTANFRFGSGVSFAAGTAEAVLYASEAGGTTTLAGVLTSSGGLTKFGPGTIVLAGDNALSLGGQVNINGGTLGLAHANALGAGTDAVFINDGNLDIGNLDVTVGALTLRKGSVLGFGTLSTAGSFVVEDGLIEAVLSGSGGLTKNTLGTVVLTNDSTYTGVTAVDVGTLVFDGGSLTGSTGNVTVTSGAAIHLSGGVEIARPITVLRGTGADGLGALRSLDGDNVWSGTIGVTGAAGTIRVDSGTLTLGSGSGNALLLTNNLTLAGDGDGIVNGNIGGQASRSITKAGAGTWTLAGTSLRSTAVTTISSGTLVIKQSTSLGVNTTAATGNTTLANGATLIMDGTGGDITVGILGTPTARPMTLSGSGMLGLGSLRSVGGNNAWLGNITIPNIATTIISVDSGTLTLGQTGSTINITTTRNLTVGGEGDGIIAADVTGTTGAGTLTKIGTGTWTLLGKNSNTGATTINGGTFIVEQTGGWVGTTGNVVVGLGGSLALKDLIDPVERPLSNLAGDGGGNGALRNISGDNTWLGLITVNNAAGAYIASDAGLLTLGSAFDVIAINPTTRQLTLGGEGDGLIVGRIGGTTAQLRKTGGGTWTLGSTASLTTGQTSVLGGVLRMGVAGSISAGALVVDGGTLDMQTFDHAVALVTLNSGSVIGSGTLTSNALGTSFRVESGLLGVNLAAGGGLLKLSPGTVTLSGVNTYTGDNVLREGVLSVGTDANLGDLGNDVIFGGGTLGVTGSFTTDRNFQFLDDGGTFDVAAGSVFTASGDGTFSGVGGMTKSGDGTMVLNSGAGSYAFSGGINVNGGTLAVNTVLDTGGTVVVNAGGTLGGSGTILDTVTINAGGTLAPGNSVESLATGSQNWNAAMNTAFDIRNADMGGTPGTDWDLIAITGTLTINATVGSPVNLTVESWLPDNSAPGAMANFDPFQSYSWQWVTTSGGITISSGDPIQDLFAISVGPAFSTAFPEAASGSNFFVSQASNALYINFTAVPEPGSLLLAGLAAAGLGGYGWRRRRKEGSDKG